MKRNKKLSIGPAHTNSQGARGVRARSGEPLCGAFGATWGTGTHAPPPCGVAHVECKVRCPWSIFLSRTHFDHLRLTSSRTVDCKKIQINEKMCFVVFFNVSETTTNTRHTKSIGVRYSSCQRRVYYMKFIVQNSKSTHRLNQRTPRVVGIPNLYTRTQPKNSTRGRLTWTNKDTQLATSSNAQEAKTFFHVLQPKWARAWSISCSTWG